uniref:C2H2-type domain-containing protein n=1 Tax=viral metagenome TaxID=1070528 RepID=A0A6H1ZFH4_9ZZZZ
MLKLSREQHAVLKSRGYTIEELPGMAEAAKITLYKKDQGAVIAMPNLPADPNSLRRYLDRGFKLRPEDFAEKETPKSEVTSVACDQCGKICKSDFGLKAHLRSHKN